MGHSYSRLILLVLAGCPHPPPDRADPPAASTPDPVVVPPPPTAPPLATAAVEVRLLGTKPAAFQVVSKADAVDLLRAVTIEREPDADRYPIGPLIQLVETCDARSAVDAGPCLSLPAKGTITPVPWTGFDCNAQCPKACRANAYLGPGRFRYVVKSCDGKQQWESPYFDLPPHK